MKNIIVSLAFLALLVAGVWFSTSELMPNSEMLVPLRPMGSTEEMLKMLNEGAGAELEKRPILIWGQWPADEMATGALKALLAQRESAAAVTQIWVDAEFQHLYSGRPVYLRGHEQSLRAEVRTVLEKGERLVIVTSPIFAASLLEGTPAAALAKVDGDEKPDSFMSVIVTDFPRRREDEEGIKIPCALPHIDKTGTGPLGCRILQSGRIAYRKSFPVGTRVGLFEKINVHDFLLLTATEPEAAKAP